MFPFDEIHVRFWGIHVRFWGVYVRFWGVYVRFWGVNAYKYMIFKDLIFSYLIYILYKKRACLKTLSFSI